MSLGEALSIVRQGELIEQIGSLIADSMPGDWVRVLYDVKSAGSYGEELCYLTDADGTQRHECAPDEAHDLVEELRQVMYRSGAGTWFSLEFTVVAEPDTGAHAEAVFNYDDMPDWVSTPVPATFVADLLAFPRDSSNMPGWLTEQVELARADHPDEVEKLAVQFYREILRYPGGRERLSSVYRREREDDVKTDAVFRSGGWHSTVELWLSLDGYDRMEVRQVSAVNARAFLDEGWGLGSELYAPMVIDADERREEADDSDDDGNDDIGSVDDDEIEPFSEVFSPHWVMGRWRWSRTSAAAAISVIRQGSSVMRRRAGQVAFSRALARSAGACSALIIALRLTASAFRLVPLNGTMMPIPAPS